MITIMSCSTRPFKTFRDLCKLIIIIIYYRAPALLTITELGLSKHLNIHRQLLEILNLMKSDREGLEAIDSYSKSPY